MQINPYLSPCTNKQLQIDQGLQHKTRSAECDWSNKSKWTWIDSHSEELSQQDTDSKDTKTKINKWNFMMLKSLCSAKDNIIQAKHQPTE